MAKWGPPSGRQKNNLKNRVNFGGAGAGANLRWIMIFIALVGGVGLVGLLYVISQFSIWHLAGVSLLIVGLTWLFARNFG